MVVNNEYGSVTSAVAVLTVNGPPAITEQPQSCTNFAGTTAVFNVTAVGTESLVYQWRLANANLPGATGMNLTIPNVQVTDAGNYTVVVTNAYGGVTSAVAVLTVNGPPAITRQPQSCTSLVGTSAVFNVTAVGTGPLVYQWRFNDANLTGVTASNLTIANVQLTDAGNYTVVVTNAYGSVTSAVALLTVHRSFEPPVGGWAYVYTGDSASGAPRRQNQPALDGTWRHENGSDEWNADGRGPGVDQPGGVESANGTLTVENANPATSGDNNNRKLFFTHSVTQEGVSAVNLLDAGVTICFRARLTPPDAKAEITLPNGHGIFYGGKGMFNVSQSSPSSLISFSLVQQTEDGGGSSTLLFPAAGLTMNGLSTDTPDSATALNSGVNSHTTASQNPHTLGLDPTLWHEFWITIQTNDATPENGTHSVTVYTDCSTRPYTFNVTAGGQDDVDTSVTPNWTDYIGMGLNNAPTVGAMDVDFYAYKPGVQVPYSSSESPWISGQPQSQIVPAGTDVILQATAGGTEPLSYRWEKNGIALAEAGNVTGTTTNTLRLANVQLSDLGDYRLVITNTFGSITSAVAVVTVWSGPIPTPAQGWIVAWGDNSAGQTDVPAGLTNVVAIAGGGSHNLALQAGGTVTAWGGFGQAVTNVPAGVTNVMAIAGGLNHCLALRSNGTVVAWYYSSGSVLDVPAGLSNVVGISAGGSHSLALRSDGTVAGWSILGSSIAVPPGLSNVVSVSAGGGHSLALRSDGTVVAWGANGSGEANVPAGLNHVVAIEAGGTADYDGFSLALCADGTVVGWGYNWYGQTNIPPGLSNVVAIAAGRNHALALRADRTAVAWGNNEYGQADVPVWWTNVTAVTAGAEHSLALLGGVGPRVLVPPETMSAPAGMTVTLSVTAAGSQPLAYQWRFNGAAITGATNSELTLSGLQPTHTGTYNVIVTNAYGALTSANAMLTVTPEVTRNTGWVVAWGETGPARPMSLWD